MDLIVDAFEPAFMQRALVGSLVAVVATSLVGTWVVLRGWRSSATPSPTG